MEHFLKHNMKTECTHILIRLFDYQCKGTTEAIANKTKGLFSCTNVLQIGEKT